MPFGFKEKPTLIALSVDSYTKLTSVHFELLKLCLRCILLPKLNLLTKIQGDQVSAAHNDGFEFEPKPRLKRLFIIQSDIH